MSLILVVDDLAIIREPIAASLRRVGYRTACAADGREALASIEATRPDLVLLDVSMPVMDGLAFLASIRSQPRFARLPVVLLTAAGDRARVVDAARLGVQDCLMKSSFTIERLLACVGTYCRAEPPGDGLPGDAGGEDA